MRSGSVFTNNLKHWRRVLCYFKILLGFLLTYEFGEEPMHQARLCRHRNKLCLRDRPAFVQRDESCQTSSST
jgi:hypothetical protein